MCPFIISAGGLSLIYVCWFLHEQDEAMRWLITKMAWYVAFGQSKLKSFQHDFFLFVTNPLAVRTVCFMSHRNNQGVCRVLSQPLGWATSTLSPCFSRAPLTPLTDDVKSQCFVFCARWKGNTVNPHYYLCLKIKDPELNKSAQL